jgi:hypothetical protein
MGSASVASAVEIWAPDNLGPTNAGSVGDRIIKFDSANPTGTVVTVGATGVAGQGFGGMDFNASGVLYGVTSFGTGFTTSNLYTINTSTGAATLVGNTQQTYTDLSFNPATGQMQGVTATGGLYNINLANGASSLIGNISGLPSGALLIGLATNLAGLNHVHDLATDQMYQVVGGAAVTMSSTIGIDTNFSQGMTMNYSGGNAWYLGSISSNPSFASEVRLMNNATGGTTSILGMWPNNGASGLPQYETGDLAINPIPEPATFAVIGLGLAALAARRRK